MIQSKYVCQRPDGSLVEIQIQLGAPEPDKTSVSGDYCCKVEIPELGLFNYCYGIDPLQAHCLSVRCLRYLLEPLISEGWRFYIPGHLDRELDILASYL